MTFVLCIWAPIHVLDLIKCRIKCFRNPLHIFSLFPCGKEPIKRHLERGGLKKISHLKWADQISSLHVEPDHENTRRPIGMRGDAWHTLPPYGVQQCAQGVYVEKRTRRKTASGEKSTSVALFLKGKHRILIKLLTLQHPRCSRHCLQACRGSSLSSQLNPACGDRLFLVNGRSLLMSYSDWWETIEMTEAFWRWIWENYKTQHKAIKNYFLNFFFFVFNVCLKSLDLWIHLNWTTHKDTRGDSDSSGYFCDRNSVNTRMTHHYFFFVHY